MENFIFCAVRCEDQVLAGGPEKSNILYLENRVKSCKFIKKLAKFKKK